MNIFNLFHCRNLKGDIFGGITAAIVSLPLALAFGLASGAGAEAGLYGAIVVGFFAAIFGGTPTLISEPTGPMTVVMTTVVTSLVANNPENGLAMAFTVVMIAGVFQIIMGTLKLGKYITLMPYSVISGFMSGIGIILIILQIAPLIGHPTPSGSLLEKIAQLPSLLKDTQWHDALIGIIALVILFLTPAKLRRRLPPQLLVLIVCTLFSVLWLSNSEIRRIGELSLGLPSLYWPTFTSEQINAMLVDGIVLGMLGCIDALLTAVISDSLTRHEHKSNKELIGQGIGNVMSGIVGGLPGAGATMGTVVNIQTGARTAVSGVTRVLVLLICVVIAADLTQYVPLAVLAAIALKVGVDILDWSFIKRAHRVSGQAALIMYGVILLTVFVDLIIAVGLGVFIANVLTIERLSNHQSKNNIKAISDTDDELDLLPEEKAILEALEGQVLLLYFSGPLIFGMSKAIAREHDSIHQYDGLIIDLSEVPLMDATALLAIENVVLFALDNQCRVLIACNKTKTLKQINRLDVIKQSPSVQLKASRLEALQQFQHES